MENMIISFNVVVPLFLNILLGYILKITKLWDEHTLKVMNKAVFKSFLPILLFYNVYNTDLKSGLNPKLMIFASSCVFIMFLLLCLLVPLFEKEKGSNVKVAYGSAFLPDFIQLGDIVTVSGRVQAKESGEYVNYNFVFPTVEKVFIPNDNSSQSQAKQDLFGKSEPIEVDESDLPF